MKQFLRQDLNDETVLTAKIWRMRQFLRQRSEAGDTPYGKDLEHETVPNAKFRRMRQFLIVKIWRIRQLILQRCGGSNS